MICSRMDEPTVGGYSPSVVTVWGELLLVAIVVVSPTQTCSVSFQATVQARTDTEPTESPVTESVYVAPVRLRLPLFVTSKYCGGGTLPAAKVKDVVEGVAFHVPEVTVWGFVPCAVTPAKTGIAVPADT